MLGLLAVLGVVALLAGVCAFWTFAALGANALWRRLRAHDSAHVTVAAIWLGGAALILATPVVVRPLVESRNNWVDQDGNGMLDPLVNGSYDWMDINGGDFVRVSGLLVAIIIVGTIYLARKLDSSPIRRSSPQSGDAR